MDYPKVRKADVLVAMSQTAFDTYLKDLKESGTLVIDPDLVELDKKRFDVNIKKVDATKKASLFGKTLLANMIMLGALINIINIASKEAVINALKESIPEKNLDEDMRAIEAGLEIQRD